MAKIKTGISSVVLMTGSLMLGGISNAEASEFLGVFCWDAVVDGDEDGGGDGSIGHVKVAISDMGDSHFIFNGTVAHGSEVEAAYGNAEIVDDKVIFAGYSAVLDEIDNGMSACSWSMSLDRSTLSGRSNMICRYYYDGFEPLHYMQSSVNLTSCP